MLLVVLHIYYIYLVIFTQKKRTNSGNFNFIAVVPVTVCKDVHGLANVVI